LGPSHPDGMVPSRPRVCWLKTGAENVHLSSWSKQQCAPPGGQVAPARLACFQHQWPPGRGTLGSLGTQPSEPARCAVLLGCLDLPPPAGVWRCLQPRQPAAWRHLRPHHMPSCAWRVQSCAQHWPISWELQSVAGC